MACIGCGLALNGDGKGRVEIDTEGGLECLGVGDSGTSDSAGAGLGIKVDPAAGNSLAVTSAGVYVPRSFGFESYYGTASGSVISDPGYGEGGSTYISASASISISNTSTLNKNYMYQAVVYYSSDTATTPFWVELAVQEAGGGWSVPSAQFVATGSIVSPVLMLPQNVGLAAGESKQLDARMHLYRGTLASWRVSIVAWGGYS